MPESTGSSPEQTDHTKICSVDRALVERFLVLVRDNYPKADRASFFLEEVSGKTHALITANLRDVLSHLATLLSPDTQPQDWEAQIASAEEHFRRAIQEPYAIALGNLREKFNAIHGRYEENYHHISKLKRRGFLAAAPDPEAIQKRLRKISDLASEGRSAKRRNRIDEKWDDGVASYIEAYNDLEVFTAELSTHIQDQQSLRDGSQGKTWGILGVIAAVVFFIVSTALVLFPSFTTKIQTVFGTAPPQEQINSHPPDANSVPK